MSGGTLILLGIILKIIGVAAPWPATCFGFGGALKILYMVLGVRYGHVKAGSEIALLVLGLTLIFSAVYFQRSLEWTHLYVWFLTIGVAIKLLFIVLFVKRQKRATNPNN